ncbi:hypothetical protein GE061_018238 [Apolygus lucorum]|uniref:Uncharacterized protein n=1 Tax=Apolygus lucorum TaxID=248454 RepID=A0A6A4IW62_APOLU|nr:hypothetical protein GE061_018238 [Apolygus lucorum]
MKELWIRATIKGNTGTFETFFHQYQRIRSSVRKSHVQIYGDFSVGSGAMAPKYEAAQRSIKMLDEGLYVDNKIMPVYALKLKVAKSNETAIRTKAQRDLQVLLEGRGIVDRLMEKLVREATADQPHLRSTVSGTRLGLSEDIFPCYMELLNEFHTHCFGLEHEYLIHQYYKLANICVLRLDTSQLLLQLRSLCLPYKSAVFSRVL